MPLVFRDKGTSGTQIDVRTGSISVGHIGKEMFSEMAGGGPRWRWYLKIDHDAAPKGFVRDGYVDDWSRRERRLADVAKGSGIEGALTIENSPTKRASKRSAARTEPRATQ